MPSITEISAIQLVRKNPVFVKVTSDKTISQNTNFNFDLIFTASPVNNDTLTITYDETTIVFTFKTTPDDTLGTELPLFTTGTLADYVEDLKEKMEANPDVFNLFILTYTNLTDERITYALRSEFNRDASHTLTDAVTGMTIQDNQTTTSDYEENLHLVLVVDKEVSGSSNKAITHILPITDPDANPFVNFDIHTDFALKTHLPFNYTLSNTAPYNGEASDCFQRFSMRYGNRFGNPPTTKALQKTTTETFVALWGTREHRSALSNWYAIETGKGNDAVWLTMQPRTKTVYEAQPEYWYFLATNTATTDYVVKRKLYFQDGTDSTATFLTINAAWGTVQWMKLGFSQMTLTQNPANPTIAYEIWIETHSVIESEILRFDIIDTQYEYAKYFAFGNSLAGMDIVRATGKFEYSAEYTARMSTRNPTTTSSDYTRIHADFEFDKRQVQKFKGSLGFHSEEYNRYLKDLMIAEEAWWLDFENTEFVAININKGNIKFRKDDNDLYHLDFEYSFAFEDKGNALG